MRENIAKKIMTATKTKCILHWSVFVCALPNRPLLRSLFPGCRINHSQNIQIIKKSRSEFLFCQKIIEKFRPKSNKQTFRDFRLQILKILAGE